MRRQVCVGVAFYSCIFISHHFFEVYWHFKSLIHWHWNIFLFRVTKRGWRRMQSHRQLLLLLLPLPTPPPTTPMTHSRLRLRCRIIVFLRISLPVPCHHATNETGSCTGYPVTRGTSFYIYFLLDLWGRGPVGLVRNHSILCLAAFLLASHFLHLHELVLQAACRLPCSGSTCREMSMDVSLPFLSFIYISINKSISNINQLSLRRSNIML